MRRRRRRARVRAARDREDVDRRMAIARLELLPELDLAQRPRRPPRSRAGCSRDRPSRGTRRAGRPTSGPRRGACGCAAARPRRPPRTGAARAAASHRARVTAGRGRPSAPPPAYQPRPGRRSAATVQAENLATVLEVVELVVARAGRVEQHDLTGPGRGGGVPGRAGSRLASAEPAGPRAPRASSSSRLADQVDGADVSRRSPPRAGEALALGEPPRIRCTGSPAYAASARSEAATFVALESLT